MSNNKTELKSKFISIRVSNSFKEEVNSLANDYGINKTDLILNLLIDSINNKVKTPPEKANKLKVILTASKDNDEEEQFEPISMSAKIQRLSDTFHFQSQQNCYFQPNSNYEQLSSPQTEPLQLLLGYRLHFTSYEDNA